MFKKIIVSFSVFLLFLTMGFANAEISEVKLVAGDGSAADYFGLGMSVEGDYAVVGAYREGSGAVYIYKRDDTSWTQTQKLTASDGAGVANFGFTVSLSGDYLAVGAHGDNSQTGAVYIFKNNGTTWTQQTKLTASDAISGSLFGYDLEIEGEYLVVGSYKEAHLDEAAYIFKRDVDIWTQQAKLTASNVVPEEHFGLSVSISGDTVLIGAHSRAYVFTRNGTTWSQQTKLSSSSPYFGNNVSIDGDHALIGTVNYDGKGEAYIFKRVGINWPQQAKLTSSDGVQGDLFGHSGAIQGNLAVIGAFKASGIVDNTGAAYVFELDNDEIWRQQTKLISSDGTDDDRFGVRATISGDVVLIGAHYDDPKGTDSGSAYIYDLGLSSDTTISLTPDTTDPVIGDTLCIDVDVADAQGLYSAAFDMIYDPGVLTYLSASEGNFLNADSGATFFEAALLNGDEANGTLVVGVSRVADIGTVSGSGTIATVCFSVIGGSGGDITVGIDNGQFEGEEQGSVIDVTEGDDPVIPVEIGVPQNLTVTDPGTRDRLDLAWDAAPDASGYEIYRATSSGGTFELLGTTTATTYQDADCILTSVSYIYKLKAISSTGSSTGEFSSEASGSAAGLAGDINKDGRVDGRDLTILARAFGSDPGHADYNCQANLDRTGPVDGDDLVILSGSFGDQL